MSGVYLSAGHSNTDPGAVCYGRREADIAVEFRNLVAFYLQRDGIPHQLDGKGTTNLPLREAVKQVKGFPVGVEFHCNAADNPSATGTETLSGPKDMVLGAQLCRAISDALGIRNRGAKPENAGQHAWLAFVQAGGIIVELFFITNAADMDAYDARKWVAAREVALVLASAWSLTDPR